MCGSIWGSERGWQSGQLHQTVNLTVFVPTGVRIPLPAPCAGVAQGQSNCFVNSRSWVQIPPPAPVFS